MLLKDQYSNTTTFDDLIDLGEGFELTTKKPAKPKVKISNHLQWMYAWSKYRTAIVMNYTQPLHMDIPHFAHRPF